MQEGSRFDPVGSTTLAARSRARLSRSSPKEKADHLPRAPSGRRQITSGEADAPYLTILV